MRKRKQTDLATDLATILSLSPPDESGMRRISRLLPEIEVQKASGVSYSRMAEALGLPSAHFRVYLHRAKKAKKRAPASNLNIPKMAGGGAGTLTTNSVRVTSTEAKPVTEIDAKIDLSTLEGQQAVQAARFNFDVFNNDDGE